MHSEMLWYFGCPIAVAGMTAIGVRLGRARAKPVASADQADAGEPTLVLAAAPEVDGADASPRPQALGRARARTRAVLRGLRVKVVTLVRRESGEAGQHAAGDGQGEPAAPEAEETPMGLAPAHDGALAVGAAAREMAERAQLAALHDGPDHALGPVRTASHGVGIVEVPIAEAQDDDHAGTADWAAVVATRETELARTLHEEAARAQQLEAEAQALNAQHELERIAVAERARVHAEARMRLWFVRLDDELDAPSVAQRCALVGTLAIAAPWAGKLLRVAYQQEQEPRVRARIIGALATGGHLAASDPFDEAVRHGGIERAAVWEVLQPRRSEAEWIPALLEPLLVEAAFA